MKTLSDPELFWGGQDSRVEELTIEGLTERLKGNLEKFRKVLKLNPEIMFPKELPLKYIKSVKVND
ncbi:MAG: hypothetical protein A3B96_00685 [Candidatus Spechtbacteria bacterium RIFCSPHIGHO2_02_FULL_43_15b]|uniref:Uncharacterized protein n=1 Tax=Candidatus Spechtbacteria bacterium RIFCSPHIGHO2_01_FULL_43_30 TaxID=1802158 RepID=A0A1G2H8C7_9BACT|nr:MAG: hypothetical protein A2827_01665 [Candidatus Spechtbacteria bacterium RIFCSPHIGHO2_01_FULL_43_30]OGZ59970.1 MAG: hypothetical protein A3B96_00685 [Candidatus Spechtbacteria bacterium RIFCSPHIGHO2_02_FULL_43_15b]